MRVGAFSESLRQELADKQVRVSLIEPVAVDTELRDHLRPEIRAAQEPRVAALLRLCSPTTSPTLQRLS